MVPFVAQNAAHPQVALKTRTSQDIETGQAEKDNAAATTVTTVTPFDAPIFVEFEDGDPRNPVNFSSPRKWSITFLASFSTFIGSITAAGYILGADSMCADLNCTHFQATVGISMYTLGFGIVPLVTASFSEEFGRQPLYFVAGGSFFILYLMVALAPNVQTVLIGRFLQGSFGSTWNTMVGGTISDIWKPSQRGVPMAIFTAAAISGTGFGPMIAGWIEENADLEWKWIEWVLMMICAIFIILLPIVMKETRASIVLRGIARKTRKETGNPRYRARVEVEGPCLKKLVFISCTRPIYLLFAEPVVFSFSLWVGFAWGMTYALVSSISLSFETLYDFNKGEVGSVFATMIVGSILGYLSNTFQERLYHSNHANRGPEARLYSSCAAAVMLPAGIFLYSWTSSSYIHWSVPCLAIVVRTSSSCIYIIYVAAFAYLADTYGPYASSALAGQSMCRNLAAMGFPLFTTQLYNQLGFHDFRLLGCYDDSYPICPLFPRPDYSEQEQVFETSYGVGCLKADQVVSHS
ncbi:MFS polyamine transporter [Hymenopellis radicata]|nr:MFS polyamine transporter [Hymenopellis radicata]